MCIVASVTDWLMDICSGVGWDVDAEEYSEDGVWTVTRFLVRWGWL